MNIKQQIEHDLKQAMLAGDKTLVSTLRGLKSSILNEEVAKGLRGTGLANDELITLLTKESKKRQESADLFAKGGYTEKAKAELAEKEVIDNYLPKQMDDKDLRALVDQTIKQSGNGQPQIGQIIGAVKQKTGPSADGARIAQMVKEALQ